MRKGHAGVLLVDLMPRGGLAVPMRWSNGPTDGPLHGDKKWCNGHGFDCCSPVTAKMIDLESLLTNMLTSD